MTPEEFNKNQQVIPSDLSDEYHRAIKASEGTIKLNELIAEMELIMRQPVPNRAALAIVRANCLDAVCALDDIAYWATKLYRGEK